MSAILHVVHCPVDVVEQWVGGHAASDSHSLPFLVQLLEGQDDLEAESSPVLSLFVVGGRLREDLERHLLHFPLGEDVGLAPFEWLPHGGGVVGDLNENDEGERV